MRLIGRWLLRLLALAISGVIAVQLWFFGHIYYWRTENPRQTAFIAKRVDELEGRKAIKQQWIAYRYISPHLKRAIIAAEDAKFSEHDGFDWDSMQNALDKNWRKGKVVAGGSTITQQLAKNLFLSGERSYWRKGQEAVLTLMLEQTLSKERILELYLNVVEWGETVFGAEAAARNYFDVSAQALSAEQAARLAAMLTRPRYYERYPHAPWLSKKTAIILQRMKIAELP